MSGMRRQLTGVQWIAAGLFSLFNASQQSEPTAWTPAKAVKHGLRAPSPRGSWHCHLPIKLYLIFMAAPAGYIL